MWGECTRSTGEVGRSSRKVLLGGKKEENRKIFGKDRLPCPLQGVES